MKQIARLLGSITVIAASLAGGQGWAQDASSPGLLLARQLCSECHAVERARPRSPDPAVPSFETIANVPGMTAMALSVALQSSHRTMPNVMLDPNELSSIVAYVLSLRRAN